MIYSVWNQAKRGYDYFESASKQETANTPSPKHIGSGELGVPIARAAWPLPSDARLVGHGPNARGRVSRGAGVFPLGAVDFESPGFRALLLGGVGLLLWKYVR